ncbi:hypothetical protein [Salinisphaera aquimarina]|uniref:Endonuclease/exonuclease/phosphatase domain-containing protein n=1 Tax=Salinisphaera aquimarina TaxID=2094031 RepID=A0ABV7ENJ7_9GAMM
MQLLRGNYNGWGSKKNLDSVVAVINRFDLVAVEEVMDLETVEKLADKLSALSGDNWGQLGSRAVGRGSYKEYRLGVEVWT